jgi:hypothetical protein
MSRPPTEEIHGHYSENWSSWDGTSIDYPVSLRDFYRGWSGGNSPGWPRLKRHNDLEVYRSRYEKREYFVQRNEHTAFPSVYDQAKCIYSFGTPANVTLPSGMPPPGVIEHNIEAGMITRNKAIDKVKDMKVNLAQLIAERRQVEKSITDVVNRLSRAVRAMKRRDIKAVQRELGYAGGPKKLSGRLAQDWLAWQYGWKPLLGDVKGLAEHFARRELGRKIKIYAKYKAQVTSAGRTGFGNVLGFIGAAKYTYGPVTTSSTTVLEFRLMSEFAQEGEALGLHDPLLLAWELLPYSFVIDWFLPIGDFLSRWNYADGLQYVDGSTTLHSLSEDHVESLSSRRLEGAWEVSIGGATLAHTKAMRLSRERHWPDPPRPILTPTIADAYTPTRFFNAISLLRVAFNK